MLLSTGAMYRNATVLTGYYALINKIVDENLIADTTPVAFTAEVSDTLSLHDNSTDNSRITVPAAWNGRYVRCSGNFTNDAASGMYMIKSGSSFQGGARFDDAGITAVDHGSNLVSAPIVVSTGEYFEWKNVLTVIDCRGDDGTWSQLQVMPTTFSGALVAKTSGQAISANTITAMTWDSETYDLNTFHDNVTANTRLTVPSGVTLVRLTSCLLGGNVTGQLVTYIYKGGAHDYGLPQNDSDSSGAEVQGCVSAPMAVTAGNYFEAMCQQASATTIANGVFTWFSIEVLPAALKYALVRRSSNQAVTAATPTIINWDTEVVDTDAWHDAGDPSKLTVPSGVSKVRLTFNVITEATHAGDFSAQVLKNGASFIGKPRQTTNTAGGDSVGGQSAIIDVAPGDYFQVEVRGDASLNIGSNTASWFSIEEVTSTAA